MILDVSDQFGCAQNEKINNIDVIGAAISSQGR